MIKMDIIKDFSSIDVAKYYLARTEFDGELISPLKMQKLVYYAYVWVMTKGGIRLFDEMPEAWPNGPVFPCLYRELKTFGSSPISTDFIKNEEDVEKKVSILPDTIKEIVDKVYEKYSTLTAFELVTLTHCESPWQKARAGLGSQDSSSKVIEDEDILQEYN